MREYSLDKYEEKLNKQVIHMDQAVCYCPEFRATKSMRDYPSRKLQLSRAIYKNELEPSDYSAQILFNSILSGQGERWQNFGENQEDFTDVMVLSREMIVKKGFAGEIVSEFKSTLRSNNGHMVKVSDNNALKWQEAIPTANDSNIFLLLDDATAEYAADAANNLGCYFKNKNIMFYPKIEPVYNGWEYFAYGLIDDGIEHGEKLVNDLKSKGIKTIVTLSGQTEYLWKVHFPKIGIHHDFEVRNVIDEYDPLKVNKKVYLYGGSFYTRFLRKEKRINALIKNTRQEAILNSCEFTPLLNADCRINEVTIWQKPLCAEYTLIGMPEEMRSSIFEDSIKDIEKGTHQTIVVFDPYAYQMLKDRGYKKDFVYFANLI